MKILAFTMVALAVIPILSTSDAKKGEEKEIEKQFRDAFKSAFSNRSDEIGQFFNETFGPGGNASDVSERFVEAWEGASEGVRRFVKETYWNISQIIERDNSSTEATNASSMELISAGIHKRAEDTKKETVSHHREIKSNEEDDSVVTRAWNYFKSVFGNSTPNQSSPQVNAALPPQPHVSSHGAAWLGFIISVASLLLVVQTASKEKYVTNRRESAHQVPSGYVRIESF